MAPSVPPRFPPKQLLFVTLSFVLDYLAIGAHGSSSWEHLSLRYGTWYKPPRTPREARNMGYRRVNGICLTEKYHGFLYVHPHNDKSRLIFDLNDRLSGIQTAIPGNMLGYDGFNRSIRVPNKDIIPPILLSNEEDSSGVQMYTITAYFKHPSLICSPIRHQSHSGKGLYIQTGYEVDRQYEKIPLDAGSLPLDWKTGSCLPSMGLHYFKWLSPSLPCERLYPVFLMYNMEGQLGGFGWLFQGTPESESPRSPVKWLKLDPNYYPALFDPTMLPTCMFNPAFRVFGIRIYLRDEETMKCPVYQEDIDEERVDEGGNHHFRHNNNNGNDVAGTSNPRHRHHHRKTNKDSRVKPVVKIPTTHTHNTKTKNKINKNFNNKITNNDKFDYLGPAFNVRGTNSSFNSHRGAKKNEHGSTSNDKKDIIVDDVKYGGGGGGHSACLKPLNLLSLILITFISFQVFSNLSSYSSLSQLAQTLTMPDGSIILLSSLSSVFEIIVISVKKIYLPFMPSNLSYYLSIVIAIVPFIKSFSFVVQAYNSSKTTTTTTTTTTTITNPTTTSTTNASSFHFPSLFLSPSPTHTMATPARFLLKLRLHKSAVLLSPPSLSKQQPLCSR